jgi:subtilisin family serine protease
MASPAAAGVAALILGENPGMSLGALKTALKNSADDEGKVGHDEFYGHGFVNAASACGVN